MHKEQETVLFFDIMNLLWHSLEQNLNKVSVLLKICISLTDEEFNLQKHILHLSETKISTITLKSLYEFIIYRGHHIIIFPSI